MDDAETALQNQLRDTLLRALGRMADIIEDPDSTPRERIAAMKTCANMCRAIRLPIDLQAGDTSSAPLDRASYAAAVARDTELCGMIDAARRAAERC